MFYLSARLFSNKKELTAAVYVACLDFIKSSKFHVHKKLLIYDYFDKSTRKKGFAYGNCVIDQCFLPTRLSNDSAVHFRFSIYISAGVFPCLCEQEHSSS